MTRDEDVRLLAEKCSLDFSLDSTLEPILSVSSLTLTVALTLTLTPY